MASSNSSGPEVSRKDADFEKREAEDCISRKEVLRIFREEWDDSVFLKRLNELPPVYPKSDASYCKLEDLKDNALDLQAVMLNDLWKANTQLKKQIEMLKLDRECDKSSGKWIPTSETMPDNPNENVLVCDIDGDIYKAYLSDYDGWRRSEDFEKVKNVIAWQPLPPAYKIESEDQDED